LLQAILDFNETEGWDVALPRFDVNLGGLGCVMLANDEGSSGMGDYVGYLVISAGLSVFSAWANAQTQGGVVRGNTQINAAVGSQTSIAAGGGNIAQSNVGVVKGDAGSTEINAVVGSQTTMAVGAGNKAQSNIGVASDTRGRTQIDAAVGSMTTIAAGAGNTAKTNIGVVKGQGGKVTVGVGSVTNVVGGSGKKGCINIGTKGVDGCE
jgi:hypothetical protein